MGEKMIENLEKHQKQSEESAKKFTVEKEEVFTVAKKARLEREKKEKEEKQTEEAKRDRKKELKEQKELDDIMSRPIPGLLPDAMGNKAVKLDKNEIDDMLTKPGPAPPVVTTDDEGRIKFLPGEEVDGSHRKRMEEKLKGVPLDDTPTL